MVTIIPAILAKDFGELAEKIKKVESLSKWIQIDVADGIFAPNVTWNQPEELKKITTSAFLEVHLMVAKVEKVFDAWLVSGAKRLIVPADDGSDPATLSAMIQKARHKGVGIGIAMSPEVQLAQITDLVPMADVVLLLAVPPGFSGQPFQPQVLEKIKELCRQFPDIVIEVDGGINPQTAKQCVEVGADALVSGSYIFTAADPKKAIAELQTA